MDISFDFSCLFLVFLAFKELRNLEHEAPLYDLTIATNTKTYIKLLRFCLIATV